MTVVLETTPSKCNLRLSNDIKLGVEAGECLHRCMRQACERTAPGAAWRKWCVSSATVIVNTKMASNTTNIVADAKGYDCQFKCEVPDALVCAICAFVVKDPQQVTCCGSLCCKRCLEEYKQCSTHCPSKECSNKDTITSFPDKKSTADLLRYINGVVTWHSWLIHLRPN